MLKLISPPGRVDGDGKIRKKKAQIDKVTIAGGKPDQKRADQFIKIKKKTYVIYLYFFDR